ncbi:MAG TPA: class I SAM-dependent methyltransferase [Solirubrobacterales bacterium]|jgi:predicted O-methyltransferase YrrM|nr:class I SAM-dependent methyltransferase [Solirubrobacterales bacterium]
MPTLTATALSASEDARARAVVAAVAIRRRHLTDSERADIERIEARREELSEERREVELRFYPTPGAGGSGESSWSSRFEPLGEVCRRASAPRYKAMTLYGLVRGFAPGRALEMGTCVGISGAYQGTALRHGGSEGEMIALEGAPDLAAVAAETFAALGLDQIDVRVGPFSETLPPVLEEGPLAYAFVDGHHQEQATLDYFELLLPHAPGALLVFDDIRWSDGMLRAWERIAADPRVDLAIDLGSQGLAFTRSDEPL